MGRFHGWHIILLKAINPDCAVGKAILKLEYLDRDIRHLEKNIENLRASTK